MKSLLRLGPYIRPFWWLIAISALLAIPLSALRVSPAPMIQYIFDKVLVPGHERELALFPALLIGLYLINFVVRFFHYYLLRIVIIRMNQQIKNDMFSHLLGLSADYFTSKSTGSLISRTMADPQFVDAGMSCINVIIREPITFLMLLGYTLFLNWKLTVLLFVIFPPLSWVFATSNRLIKRYISSFTAQNEHLFSVLQESFSGIRIVKAFRLEGYVKDKFFDKSDLVSRQLLKISKLEEIAHPLVELLIAFVIGGVIYFGGREVLTGAMSKGELFSYFAAFAMMLNPIKNLNEVNLKLSQAAGATDRIFDLFDWKSSIKEPVTPRPFKHFNAKIEVDAVSFAYPDAPERLVLKDVSFDVVRGQTVALVGASGAGKSSLVGLLPRVFDVTQGNIRIDGVDIRDFSLDALRSQIAVVSQDVFLFNDSIEQNIRCGRLDATHEEVREAARKANALEFIEAAPDGFKTVIGDRGQKLSGGQRQRLSIARAFLRESPILILDEATSALDTASERAVQKALEELMNNRTTLVIAHRLSTIQNAHRIFVLREGAVVEEGRHADLLARNGEYAMLYRHAEGVTA